MKLRFWARSVSLLSLTAGLTSMVAAPSVAATFQPPADNTAPGQATGGASRGEFIPPTGNTAPSQATGGASRADFIPPADNTAPSQASGGASRADFVPPADSTAPSQASGGASRADFVPPADSTAPSQAAGGASRADFVPPADSTAPSQAAGGASRADFVPPADNAAPQQTAGGSSRASIVADEQVSPDAAVDGNNLDDSSPALSAAAGAMIAVMPESFYGTTLLERPTFMAYLPASGAEAAVFSLKDEAGNLVYRTDIPVSGEAGIIAVSMSADAPVLELDKNYQWFVTLKLDGTLTPNSPFVDGWIKRIEPDAALAEVLIEGDKLEVAEALAENGIWYDSAALFAQLRSEQPENSLIAWHWEEFLNSVSLDELLSAPIAIASLRN